MRVDIKSSVDLVAPKKQKERKPSSNMTIEIKGGVEGWTPVIIRGRPFTYYLTFRDKNWVPVPIVDARFTVEPNGAPDITWSALDGRFTKVGVGRYQLALDENYTPTLLWDSGTFRIEVMDAGGGLFSCIADRKPIFVKDGR